MAEDIKDNNNINEHDDHEYDGIKELNNRSPWWVIILFLITFGFSGIYAVRYFGYPNNGNDQISEYKAAVEAQKLKMDQAKEGKAATLPEPKMIAAGKKIFMEKGCVACHGMDGGGNAVGPNLCDNYWLNGCKLEDIIHTITEGRPEKGMTPFKSTLSGAQIKQVAIYIKKSLVGSKPANPKAAQGVECK